MPTTPQYTWSNKPLTPAFGDIDDAMGSILGVQLKVSTTFAAGTVLGRVTATGRYAPYASGNSDGSEVARGLLRKAATTDSAGNIVVDEWGGTVEHGEMLTEGNYYTAELTGLDATAITALNGHLINPGGPNEVLHIG